MVVKERYGHQCQWAWVAVSLVQWDGLPPSLADEAYTQIAEKTANYGSETERKCGTNGKKTCACQGSNGEYNGASYTYGCSWTMYTNCCKFCRSTSEARKYRLKEVQEEGTLENICDLLTDCITPHFAQLAPDCHNNMCLFEDVAEDCRIGTEGSRPFSGITTVLDYCAHSHRDSNNMIGGCTVVVTLTRPENRVPEGTPVEDEQFHVLPLYVPDATLEELDEKVYSGGIEALSSFRRTITVKNSRQKACKRGRMNAEKKRMLDGYIPENYTSQTPPSSPKPVKQSPLKKLARPYAPKPQSPSKTILYQPSTQQMLHLKATQPPATYDPSSTSPSTYSPSTYNPSYQRRPIPSTSTSSAQPLHDSQSLFNEFSRPVSHDFSQYYRPAQASRPPQASGPPQAQRPPIRTIMIDNPCIMRQLPPSAPTYSSPAPAYIPRIPQPRPYHPPQQAQQVSTGFVSNIVNQFSDCDSILALLEETGGQEESSLEEVGPREEGTAAAIYASYTSRLPQLDGADDIVEAIGCQLDGGQEDVGYQSIYSQYISRLQDSNPPPAQEVHQVVSTDFVDNIISQFEDSESILSNLETYAEDVYESPQSHNSYRDSVPGGPFTPADYEAEDYEDSPLGTGQEQEPPQTIYESECLEAFADPLMGGIALALPHGSILVEVAKAELHATTALKTPNKHNPCRIGLVWYQHKNLHFPNHGASECKKKTEKREFRDYLNWLKGEWVMTSSQLHARQKSGYVFPDNVRVVKTKDEKSRPEDRFHQEDYPNFVPGKFVKDKFEKIIIKEDHNLEVFQENLLLRTKRNSVIVQRL